MLLLPLPRHHRRRLLLPPGLLALAWLLWLGCVAVPPQSLFTEPPKTFALFIPRPLAQGWYTNLKQRQVVMPTDKSIVLDVVQMGTSATWLRYFFEQQLRFLLPHNTQDAIWQGVSFQFNGSMTSDEAIALLATLERQPNVLYWFINSPVAGAAYVFRMPPAEPVECVGITPEIQLLHTIPMFGDVGAPPSPWYGQLAPLLLPDWRNSVLLLLLLSVVSAYRLGRSWWSR